MDERILRPGAKRPRLGAAQPMMRDQRGGPEPSLVPGRYEVPVLGRCVERLVSTRRDWTAEHHSERKRRVENARRLWPNTSWLDLEPRVDDVIPSQTSGSDKAKPVEDPDRNLKALKADDAAIPEYLWDDRVKDYKTT